MIGNRTTLALALTAVGGLLAVNHPVAPARATQETTSLMQTLEPWIYPGSAFGGASMSDAGNPDIEDVVCKSLLTTPDPVEDVARFYLEKAGKDAGPKAVVTQDDAKDRPVAVRVISVHRDPTTTILVISRGEGEKQTHVAWSRYMRFPSKP